MRQNTPNKYGVPVSILSVKLPTEICKKFQDFCKKKQTPQNKMLCELINKAITEQ